MVPFGSVRPQPGVSAEASADRAKALILPLLGLPTVEVVFGLLLLAYHEHGEDRDSGLWIYSGCVKTALERRQLIYDLPASGWRSGWPLTWAFTRYFLGVGL